MANLFGSKLPPRKGKIETLKFGNLQKVQKKLIGSSEAVMAEFENLFQRSSDLFLECNQFAQKEASDPFTELEAEALELVKQKVEVEATIHTLYEKYKDQGLSKIDPKAVVLKRESRLIIDRVQRSIDNCRPLVDAVRKLRRENTSQPSEEQHRIMDFAEDIANPFEHEDTQ